MKTRRPYLVMLVSAILLTGCKEDSPVNDLIENAAGDYLIAEAYENGALSSRFEYNHLNQLVRMQGYGKDGTLVGTGNYYYNNKGQLTSVVVQTKDDRVTTELEYDQSGQLIHSSAYDGEELIVSYTHDYEDNRVIVTAVTDNEVSSIHAYTIENGNIVREEFVHPTMPQMNWIRERFDFDDKRYGQGGYYSLAYLTDINNPRRERLTSVSGILDLDWRWEYSYNEAGYMTKATNYDMATGDKIDVYDYKLIKAK